MDYQKAASYWLEKDKDAVKLPAEKLQTEIERFICSHNTCALATGSGTYIRCTPIEYTYKDGKFWLLSEGGQKFRGLSENANVSIAIYDSYAGFGKLNSLQVSGKADIIEPWSDEYLELLEYKNIPAENLRKLPIVMHLIRVTPMEMDFLCSDLKEKGVSSRQHLVICT